jgi:hypothetical protein
MDGDKSKSERYAWSRAIKAKNDLDYNRNQDLRYLDQMMESLEVVKDNELALNIASEFIWTFTTLKDIEHYNDECLDYMTQISFNEDTGKYDHKTPGGKVLYSTKHGHFPHAILTGIKLTRSNYKLDIENKRFVINTKKWKWVEAYAHIGRGAPREGWYEKIVK